MPACYEAPVRSVRHRAGVAGAESGSAGLADVGDGRTRRRVAVVGIGGDQAAGGVDGGLEEVEEVAAPVRAAGAARADQPLVHGGRGPVLVEAAAAVGGERRVDRPGG